MSLRIGLVGATGMVGCAFAEILEQRKLALSELRPFASRASVGRKMKCRGREWDLRELEPGCFDGLDLVFFSSGDDISREWAPQAVKAGAFAIDNSAAFRMDPGTPLIVPEVNGHLLKKGMRPAVIANPNCSTIQLVVALKPLSDAFGLREVRVSSYQAVSGAGLAAQEELLEQMRDPHDPAPKTAVFQKPILFNAIPQIGSFGDDGFCSEETKIMAETKKILSLPALPVSAFTVRIPALNAHSEAVWVELEEAISREDFLRCLGTAEGLVLRDDPKAGVYPTAREVSGQDPVFVGRIHRDPQRPHLWMMWIVSDNIRKGAALNGIQIAERLFDITTDA